MRKLGWVLLPLGGVPAVFLYALWLIPVTQLVALPTVVAATFIPYLWLPTLIALSGLILLTRRRWRWMSGALTCAAVLVWGLPLFGSLDQPEPRGDLQFVSINAQYGRVDVEQLAALVRPTTDLLVIQEFTPDLEERMRDAGLEDEFPHIVAEARTDPGGAAVYAREPIELIDSHDSRFTNLLIRTSPVDGVQYTVANIHVIPPTMGTRDWRDDSREIADWLRPHVGRHFVALGDFNAISQHVTMDYFFDLGLIDPQGGISIGRSSLSTWQPTWPVGMAVPPFARIDHVLLPEHSVFAENRYVTVPGTDHKAIIGGVFNAR